MSGCAANPSPDPLTPRSGESSYPALLVDDDGGRRQASLAAWAGFTRDQGINNAPDPELHPVTATVRNIPIFSQSSLHLPLVGESRPMSEDETREALRRFISRAGILLCGEPQQLSLIQRVDGADGVKEARYQQRPFRYALRGGYGELRIGFTPDGRVTRISSTCIPETERIRRGFVGLGQQLIPFEKVIAGVVGHAVNLITSDGAGQVLTITDKDNIRVKELVVYPIERVSEPAVLEFHLAWEIVVDGTPGATIYVDSITGDVLAALPGRPT